MSSLADKSGPRGLRVDTTGRDARRQVFTPAELAPVLQRSRSWVIERCGDGTLPAIRLGSRWILRRADLISTGWLADGSAAEPPVSGEVLDA